MEILWARTRVRPWRSGAPKVMDPALEARPPEPNWPAHRRTSPPPSRGEPAAHRDEANSVANLTDAISANRNPTYENPRSSSRTKSANPLDSAENFDFNAHMNVKSALTDAQGSRRVQRGFRLLNSMR